VSSVGLSLFLRLFLYSFGITAVCKWMNSTMFKGSIMFLCTLARTFSYVKSSLPQNSGDRNNADKSIYAPVVDHFIFSLVVELLCSDSF